MPRMSAAYGWNGSIFALEPSLSTVVVKLVFMSTLRRLFASMEKKLYYSCFYSTDVSFDRRMWILKRSRCHLNDIWADSTTFRTFKRLNGCVRQSEHVAIRNGFQGAGTRLLERAAINWSLLSIALETRLSKAIKSIPNEGACRVFLFCFYCHNLRQFTVHSGSRIVLTSLIWTVEPSSAGKPIKCLSVAVIALTCTIFWAAREQQSVYENACSVCSKWWESAEMRLKEIWNLA